MTSLSIHAIVDPASPVLAEIEALYREAFPPSERKPTAFLAEAIARPDYRLLHAHAPEGFVGMALVYRSQHRDVALLEYMAISANARGSGYGSELFAAIMTHVEEPLLLEVESIREGDPAVSTQSRRIDFYRRLGCLTIERLAYLMPKVSSDLPPPMDLMVEGYPNATVSRAMLRGWLEDVYVHVYGRRADDPDINRMLAPIAATAAVA